MVREKNANISTEENRVRRKPNKINYFDYSFLFVIIFLLCFGFLMLYSASSYSGFLKHDDSMYYLNKQLIATAVAVPFFILATMLNYNIYRKLVPVLYWGSLLLVCVVKTPLGIKANGATRWIDIGPVSIQPSEAVKVAVIITVAHLIAINYKRLNRLEVKARILGYATLAAGVVAGLTSNLSTAIIIFGIAFVMVFVASPDYKVFFVVIVVAVVAILAFIFLGAEFRMERLQVWQDPEAYSSDGGYQILQGLYAIGSGGLLGKGLGQSVQKLGFIPEAQNDYIFTIICEELGIIGAISVILLFVFIIRRMFVIAGNAPNLFGSMLATGVMAHFAIQVILNIAVVTNTIPNTGVTLPLISYGGTSVVFLLIEVGLVLAVSRSIRRIR